MARLIHLPLAPQPCCTPAASDLLPGTLPALHPESSAKNTSIKGVLFGLKNSDLARNFKGEDSKPQVERISTRLFPPRPHFAASQLHRSWCQDGALSSLSSFQGTVTPCLHCTALVSCRRAAKASSLDALNGGDRCVCVLGVSLLRTDTGPRPQQACDSAPVTSMSVTEVFLRWEL